jgi:hypothetical protein
MFGTIRRRFALTGMNGTIKKNANDDKSFDDSRNKRMKARRKLVPVHLSSPEYTEVVKAIKKAQAAKFKSLNFLFG